MLRTHRAGKGPGGCGGWGLGSRNRRGPGMPPHPWSQRAGDLLWEPSRLPGLEWAGQMPSSPLLLLQSGRAPPPCLSWSPRPPSYGPKDPRGLEGGLEGRGPAWELSRLLMPKWVGQLPSTPLPLLPEGPSHLPPVLPLAALLCPQGPTRPGGGFGVQGTGLGAQQAPRARGGRAIALRSFPALPGESLPPASPDLPSLRGANPVWLPLLLPPQSPYVLPVHFGVPPVSLGVRVPHHWPAGALVVGRR